MEKVLKCYFQGCLKNGETKEHIPPKSFFPVGENNQLLTITSCKEHNNSKSKNDLYALSQICINASPRNRSQEVFITKIQPQLSFNNDAFRRMLIKDCVKLKDGSVKYKVDHQRLDEFFTALSCGIIFKSCGKQLPNNFEISHIYHNFVDHSNGFIYRIIKKLVSNFYAGKPMNSMEFGNPRAINENIYSVKVFGIPEFKSSITIVHEFFGVFKVTSILTKKLTNAGNPRRSQ